MAKVEFHAGELFLCVGFIVTNRERPSRAVVRVCKKRGTSEQWIKEGKLVVNWPLLFCQWFRGNEVRLWLSVIAYNSELLTWFVGNLSAFCYKKGACDHRCMWFRCLLDAVDTLIPALEDKN